MDNSSDDDIQPSGSKGFPFGSRPILKSPPTAPKMAERVESEKSKSKDPAPAGPGTPKKSKREERKEPRASGSKKNISVLSQMLKQKRMDFELMLMMATTQLPFSFIDEAGFKR